jgi:tetratricopeptide (TPR) repeat protein
MRSASRLLLLGLLLAGCSLPLTRELQGRHQAGQWAGRAEELTQAGRYREAEEVYRRLLDEQPGSALGDRALFGLGRLHTLPANPDRDPARAYQYFDRLQREFPDSPRAVEARAWRDLLAAWFADREALAASRTALERLRQEAERLRRDLELDRRRHRDERVHLRRDAERARQDADRLRLDIERLRAMEIELERLPRR